MVILATHSENDAGWRVLHKHCMKEFSVTSGTVLHSRKLSFKKLVMAIWEEITAVKDGLGVVRKDQGGHRSPQDPFSAGLCRDQSPFFR
jgi:hypothetical protein